MKNIYLLLLLVVSVLFSCQSTGSDKKESAKTDDQTEFRAQVMKGEELSYSADGVTMKGYIAYNDGTSAKRPGVIVVHEWWGHNAYARHRADQLAALGYTALAVDMYGDGQSFDHPDNASEFSSELRDNIPLSEDRFDAALAALKAHPTVDSTKIAAIGYCFGGGIVLTMAMLGKDLDGVAGFHSDVDLLIEPSRDLKAKVLVCNGADDRFIPASSVSDFKNKMDAIGADYEYVAYPGAIHGFTNPEADSLGALYDMLIGYNEAADKASWAKLESFLAGVFDRG